MQQNATSSPNFTQPGANLLVHPCSPVAPNVNKRKCTYNQTDQHSVEPRNKFQLSSRITSQTIPLFRRSRSIGCRISLNVTVSNRPLTLTLKLVAVTCLGEQGYGLQWLPFQSALLPPGHPARRGRSGYCDFSDNKIQTCDISCTDIQDSK